MGASTPKSVEAIAGVVGAAGAAHGSFAAPQAGGVRAPRASSSAAALSPLESGAPLGWLKSRLYVVVSTTDAAGGQEVWIDGYSTRSGQNLELMNTRYDHRSEIVRAVVTLQEREDDLAGSSYVWTGGGINVHMDGERFKGFLAQRRAFLDALHVLGASQVLRQEPALLVERRMTRPDRCAAEVILDASMAQVAMQLREKASTFPLSWQAHQLQCADEMVHQDYAGEHVLWERYANGKERFSGPFSSAQAAQAQALSNAPKCTGYSVEARQEAVHAQQEWVVMTVNNPLAEILKEGMQQERALESGAPRPCGG